jgi:hypothetical protein
MTVASPTVTERAGVRGNAPLAVAIFAFLPIILIGLIGLYYEDALRALLPMELTNFSASRAMLSGFLHNSGHGDSWLPMMHALDILKGPDRNALYQTLFFDAHIRFQYPPTSLLTLDVLAGLGLLSVRALNAINSIVFAGNAVAVTILAWLLFRRPSGVALPLASAMAVIAFAATFLFYPLVRAHLLGQIQLWIDLLFTLTALCWLLQRRLAAGFLIGLACTIKPQMGLLLLWGLAWREHRFAIGIVAGAIPPLLLSLWLYGFSNQLAYLDVLGFLSRHGESYFANNSVNGILNWYLSPDDSLRWNDNAFPPFNPIIYAGTVSASLAALAALLMPALLRRARRAALADLGAAGICTIVGSPVAWEHHYGILLPLYLVALRAIFAPQARNRAAAIAALTASWILVANFIPVTAFFAHGWAAAAQAYCLFGAVLLLATLLARGKVGWVPS